MKKVTHGHNSMVFHEKDHEYIVDGKIKMLSVTTFIHDFFPKFDEERISYFYARKHGMTQKQVLAMWAEKRDRACDYGNAVHNHAEGMIKGAPTPKPRNEKEEKSFTLVEKLLSKLRAEFDLLEPETMIFTLKYQIAGTIDMIAMSKDRKSLIILDWKTNAKINFENSYGKYGFKPVESMPDCNFSHYTLQLNLYQYILQLEGYVKPDVKVERGLIHIGDKASFMPVPDKQTEIQAMLDMRLEAIRDRF